MRQRLQCSLATPIRPQPASPLASAAEAQVWQIGASIHLLATPSLPAAGRLRLPAASPSPSPAACPTLLVYDYVSSKLGAQLRAQGQYYADAVGNAWLQHPELLLSVQGCPRPKAPAAPELPAIVTPAGHVHLLRLLFQLLHEPQLATYSAANLTAHTRLPPAAIKSALRSLVELGWWRPDAPLAESPLHLLPAARHWLTHYAQTLRRRLNAHRYRPRDPATRADWPRRPLPAECLWGGEAAAHLLLGCPAPPTSLTLYSQMPRSQLVQHLGLEPYAQGNIEILNAFAPATYFAPTDPRCAPPLLVYADLLASQKPHCESLAHEVRTRYLRQLLGPQPAP